MCLDADIDARNRMLAEKGSEIGRAQLADMVDKLSGLPLLFSPDRRAARLLGEIPVGVVTAVIGAPFFLSLLRRTRTGYEL